MVCLASIRPIRLGVLVGVALAVLSPCAADARDDEDWKVDKRLLGKEGKKSVDVSGIACTTSSGFPRQCLVIDDDLQNAQFVIVEDGKLHAGDAVRLIHNEFDHKPLELDGEGVAFYKDAFYVIGSHGHPRKHTEDCKDQTPSEENTAKISAASQIVRIRLNDEVGKRLSMHDVLEVKATPKLRQIMIDNEMLRPFVDKCIEPKDGNGVTIEGIAVMDDRLYVGFRGPSLRGGAPILSVPLAMLFGDHTGEADLAVVSLEEGRGIRDLAPYKDGLLVLAGPRGSEQGKYDVHWWDRRHNGLEPVRMKPLGDITKQAGADKPDKERKPEGLLPLDQPGGQLRLLILSDGADAEEGAPRAVLVDTP
jgi:hypothetical protein